MTTETMDTVRPAFMFMPDISGFTEFVNSTEITHAQYIIQEVLEILIECNDLNLEVGEIEGDAIFFYRIGNPPGLQELLQQVQTMYTRFHQHLKLYDQQRICPCAACSNAVNLKLKMIAHYGEVAGVSVKKYHKLFGKDVIIIHRLLKNSLNKKEYALFTTPLLENDETGAVPDWYEPQDASENYDVGEVRFRFIDLSKLYADLPPVEAPAYHLSDKTSVAFSKHKLIPAPLAKVFEPIFDLSKRSAWMEGIKKIEMMTKDTINRVGTIHRCIISQKNNPVMLTEYAKIGNDEIEYIEMDEKGMAGCHFSLQRVTDNETMVKIDALLKRNFFISTVFNLFMKSKMEKQIEKSLENLYTLVKQPRNLAKEVM